MFSTTKIKFVKILLIAIPITDKFKEILNLLMKKVSNKIMKNICTKKLKIILVFLFKVIQITKIYLKIEKKNEATSSKKI